MAHWWRRSSRTRRERSVHTTPPERNEDAIAATNHSIDSRGEHQNSTKQTRIKKSNLVGSRRPRGAAGGRARDVPAAGRSRDESFSRGLGLRALACVEVLRAGPQRLGASHRSSGAATSRSTSRSDTTACHAARRRRPCAGQRARTPTRAGAAPSSCAAAALQDRRRWRPRSSR